jgi:hypothetical protein
MYKSRIEHWGLRKSLTVRDVPELLQQVQQRRTKGSTAMIVVRGREVPSTRVERYLKRNPYIAFSSQEKTLPTDEPFVSAPTSFHLPDDMRWSDEIIRLLGQFVAGSCEGGSWCPDGIAPVFLAGQKTLTWLNDTNYSHSLLKMERFDQAFTCLDVAFDRLTHLIRDPDPTFFLYIYHTLIELPEIIRRRMTSYAAEMAAIVLPANHPLVHIFLKLSQGGSKQQLLDHGSAIFRSYFNLLERSFNSREPSFVNFARIFYNISFANQFFELGTAMSKQRDIVEVLEIWGGRKVEILHTKLSSIQMLFGSGRLEAAEALLGEVGREMHQTGESRPPVILQVYYYGHSCDIHKAKGSVDEAVDNGKRHLLAALKLYGAESARTLVYLGRLQLYCAEFGYAYDANRLLEVVESRLELEAYFHEIGMIDEEDCKSEVCD